MRYLKYLILIVFVFISGCWDRTEINDLAFVMGTAMDLSDNGNQLCTLQIATPSSEGGMSGGGNGGKDTFYVITAEGKTGNEIHQKLQKQSSRKLFFSHRSVVFISERLAKHGIEGVLDVFTHDPRNRLKTYIMVVKGEEGQNILQLNYPLKQVPIEAVREMENSGDDVAVTLKDFFISVESEGIDPIVGVIETDIQSKDPHKQVFRLAGAAVFKDLKLAGLLDINDTFGLMWVTNQLKYGRITANLPGGMGEVGMLINHADRKIMTRIGEDSEDFKIQLEGQGSLVENNTGLDINEPKNLKIITKALEDAAKKQVHDVIYKIQKKYKVDSVGFGQEIYKHNPKKWVALKDQWDTRFPEADISVDVKLIIQGEGMVHSSFESKEKVDEE